MPNSWKISQHKLLVISVLDGHGLQRKVETLQFSIPQTQEILWPMAILLFWLLMSGSMLTILIIEMLELLIFRISLILSIGISSIRIGLMRKLICSSEWSSRIIVFIHLWNMLFIGVLDDQWKVKVYFEIYWITLLLKKYT